MNKDEIEKSVSEGLLEIEMQILEEYINLHDDIVDDEREDNEHIKEDVQKYQETEPYGDCLE
jgi:hypothetical protein